VDTAEYPFFGLWSNTPLNEKPHTITVTGFIRGEGYIKIRTEMVEALRITTSDEACGFMDLPLWGRFPVVVTSYEVEEEGKEAGQCTFTLTFTRAGITAAERERLAGQRSKILAGSLFQSMPEGSTAAAVKLLEKSAAAHFEKKLKDTADNATLAESFTSLSENLTQAAGRIQGDAPTINTIGRTSRSITSLIAQGIRYPRELAQALISTTACFVNSIMEIKNSSLETSLYFHNNVKNILLWFLSQDNYLSGIEAVTVRQMITRDAVENLFRTASLCAAAGLIVRLEDPTYQQVKNYWTLYQRLEAAVNREDPDIYRAVQDLRISAAGELAARSLDRELVRYLHVPVPLLYLAHYLGCDTEKIRQLNRPADSFVMQGEIIYV
jgi:hypothetical protein